MMEITLGQRNVQFALMWQIIGIALTGILGVLAVPFSMGLFGLVGLWMPALLVLLLVVQIAAAFCVKRGIGPGR